MSMKPDTSCNAIVLIISSPGSNGSRTRIPVPVSRLANEEAEKTSPMTQPREEDGPSRPDSPSSARSGTPPSNLNQESRWKRTILADRASPKVWGDDNDVQRARFPSPPRNARHAAGACVPSRGSGRDSSRYSHARHSRSVSSAAKREPATPLAPRRRRRRRVTLAPVPVVRQHVPVQSDPMPPLRNPWIPPRPSHLLPRSDPMPRHSENVRVPYADANPAALFPAGGYAVGGTGLSPYEPTQGTYFSGVHAAAAFLPSRTIRPPMRKKHRLRDRIVEGVPPRPTSPVVVWSRPPSIEPTALRSSPVDPQRAPPVQGGALHTEPQVAHIQQVVSPPRSEGSTRSSREEVDSTPRLPPVPTTVPVRSSSPKSSLISVATQSPISQ